MGAEIVALFTHKGGTAKTTTTHSLAHALKMEGARVLVVDLDPQSNLSAWLAVDGRPASEASPNLSDVIIHGATLNGAIHVTDEGVHTVPGDVRMAGAAKILSRQQMAPEAWLKESFRTLDMERWDWILLDCPPALDNFTLGALKAASWLLVPCPPSVLDVMGLAAVLGSFDTARSRMNEDLKMLGLVPVKVDRRTKTTDDVLAQLEALQHLTETVIPINSPIAACPAFRESIFKHSPRSRSARAYADLARELTKRVADHGA